MTNGYAGEALRLWGGCPWDCLGLIMKIAVVVVLVLTAIAVALWRPVGLFLAQDSCLDRGGKWATNSGTCVDRNCAQSASSQPSYRNATICKSLNVGMSQDELYFHLGMPEANDGNVYRFNGGGGQHQIQATIDAGKVIDLKYRG